SLDLYEDHPAFDGLAQRVELIPVEPDPAVVGGCVVHPDDPEVDRPAGELDARVAGQMEYVAGAGNHISSCPKWPAYRRRGWGVMDGDGPWGPPRPPVGAGRVPQDLWTAVARYQVRPEMLAEPTGVPGARVATCQPGQHRRLREAHQPL